MGTTVEFFFDCGSPYSYLASTQIEALAQRTTARLVWRPFLVGGVFKATGTGQPEALTNMYKARYLFKDLQDWSKYYGLPPLVLPDNFPVDALKADRLALVADDLGKGPAWVHTVFRASFVKGRDVSDPNVLSDLLRQLDIDPQPAFARMLSPEIKDRLRKNTEEAVSRGAFGAPTFFVGSEMFFGNDRMGFLEATLTEAAKVAAQG